MKKGLFRFCIVVFVGVVSVLCVDRLTGKILDSMLPQISKQGQTGMTYYSLNDVDSPIVIVGSSRASHHYVSKMIEDSLCLPVYNVARDGCFFSYNCCVVNSILDRYSPKLIVWENGTEYLFESVPDSYTNLYPYYKKNEWVYKTLNEELDIMERTQLLSRIYQYNSVSHRIITRFVGSKSFVDNTGNGYLPLPPKNLRSSLKLTTKDYSELSLKETKVNRFRSTLARAREKGVKIVVVDSPVFQTVSNVNLSAQTMKSICDDYGMLFLNNSQLYYFLEHPEYFNDEIHMNDNGARRYTALFIHQIRNYFENNDVNEKH